ncbi:MAG: hypothetical protein IPK21_16740 [Haliscomenobacter sp.]|nr:hypothetical protein [Haliscomenobacter sp.]
MGQGGGVGNEVFYPFPCSVPPRQEIYARIRIQAVLRVELLFAGIGVQEAVEFAPVFAANKFQKIRRAKRAFSGRDEKGRFLAQPEQLVPAALDLSCRDAGSSQHVIPDPVHAVFGYLKLEIRLIVPDPFVAVERVLPVPHLGKGYLSAEDQGAEKEEKSEHGGCWWLVISG